MWGVDLWVYFSGIIYDTAAVASLLKLVIIVVAIAAVFIGGWR